jgi:hypothetical protein
MMGYSAADSCSFAEGEQVEEDGRRDMERASVHAALPRRGL